VTPPDENDAWFDALRGTPSSESPSDVVQNATAIRKALLAKRNQLAVTELELARFKAKLGAEGALEPRTTFRHAWYAMAAGFILCAGMAFLIVNQFIAPPQTAFEQLRGDADIQIVHVPHALDAARELSGHLHQIGIEARIIDRPNGTGVEAFIPSPQEQQVNQWLSPYHVQVGKNGQLQLEFRAK
jgi:hypothetical protein